MTDEEFDKQRFFKGQRCEIEREYTSYGNKHVKRIPGYITGVDFSTRFLKVIIQQGMGRVKKNVRAELVVLTEP